MTKNKANEERNDNEGNVQVSGYGTRHTQTILLCISIITTSLARGCITVAILAMTDPSLHGDKIQTFTWGKPIQNLIMSAFHWGDLVMQFPAGLLVCKYGGKPFLVISMVASGLIAIFIPLISYQAGWQGTLISRICMGFSQGFIFPAVHTLLGKWAPISERNRLGIMVYSGVNLATIIGAPVSAFIASSSVGWPWVFYFFGFLCILNGVVWFWLGANSPAEHHTIGDQERTFIEKSLGQEEHDQNRKIPWRAILCSVPVWTLIFTQVCAYSGYSIMLLETPTYLKLALGISIENSGLLTALPYVTSLIGTLLSSWVADHLLNEGFLTLTAIRKLFNTLGTWIPAFSLIGLMFVPAGNIALAVTFIVVTMTGDALSGAGFMLNHIDLSPNFAGIIVSLSLTISDIGNLVAPIITGFILSDPTDLERWQIVFLMTAGIYFFGNVFFLAFGSAQEQPWNTPKERGKITFVPSDIMEEMLPMKYKSETDEFDHEAHVY